MHKNKVQSPWKNLEGGPSPQKIFISRACETKLGCVLSFLKNTITFNFFIWNKTTAYHWPFLFLFLFGIWIWLRILDFPDAQVIVRVILHVHVLPELYSTQSNYYLITNLP